MRVVLFEESQPFSKILTLHDGFELSNFWLKVRIFIHFAIETILLEIFEFYINSERCGKINCFEVDLNFRLFDRKFEYLSSLCDGNNIYKDFQILYEFWKIQQNLIVSWWTWTFDHLIKSSNRYPLCHGDNIYGDFEILYEFWKIRQNSIVSWRI